MIRERDDIIKDLSSKQNFPPQSPSFKDENLRNILSEAAKNSHVIGLKYKRLLKEYDSLKSSQANLANSEDKIRNLELKVSMLETMETRCFDLEQENESLKKKFAATYNNQRMVELEKRLLDSQEMIESLKEEFESINENNNTLISKVASLEAEKRANYVKSNEHISRIAELEKLYATLEELLAKQ
jgi:predicted RNase H-like nuclease (RuvC/YqgF family)